MKIAITAEHANLEQLTGVEHYTRQLILALARVDHRNDYILYLRTPPRDWCQGLPPNFSIRVIPAPLAWTQLRVSWEVLCTRPDALLITSFSMPLIHPRNSVVTIHDLAWYLFPDTLQLTQKLWLLFTHLFAARFSKRLIAVSEQTKRDMVRVLKVPDKKVVVIHHGFSLLDSIARPTDEVPNKSSDVSNTEALNLESPFILCLGTLQPRKNLVRMIDAFRALKAESKLPHLLVIAGRAGWMCQDVLDKIKVTPDVVYLGYVEDRLALLRKADLLVQPAIYEGFGLSLLDAFSQGIPVACSNVSSLPEIAAEAAELFDPYSVKSITAAMLNVLTAPAHSEQLKLRGTERLRSFNWDDCARRTLQTLETSSHGESSAHTYPASGRRNSACTD